MLLIDEARSAYLAAARLYARLLGARIDLLADALAARAGGPNLQLTGGYRDVGGEMGVCLPDDARATMVRLARIDAALEASAHESAPIEVVTSEMDWMTIEGWLPRADSRSCVVEIEIVTDAPVTADVVLRRVEDSGRLVDQPPVEWVLTPRQLQVLELNGPAAADGRCKVVLQLRRPPERLIVRRLAITALD